MSIITEEEQVEFDKLTTRVRELYAVMSDVRTVQRQIVEDVFLRFLQQGSWIVDSVKDDVMRIRPRDSKSDNLMTKFLMETFIGNHKLMI